LSLGMSLADTLQWRTRRIDPTGLYCLGARYYDPLGGRFISADPLGHEASWDLYSFADGDPINQFDADGRFGKGIAYGIGDAMEGGSFYKSLLNPHSDWSTRGYYTGLIAAEATKQAAIFFASEGALSLMARGLALGARALFAEMRLGEEAVAGEAAAGWTALGAGTEMAALRAARSGAREAIGETGSSRILSMSQGSGKGRSIPESDLIPKFDHESIGSTLTPNAIRLARDLGRFDLDVPWKVIGYSKNAPLFISVPNKSGGEVWLSLGRVNFFDSEPLLHARQTVTYLTGAHGGINGKWKPYRGMTSAARAWVEQNNINAEVMYVMGIPEWRLREILNGEGRIICGWCWTARSRNVLKALDLDWLR
jgi:RHS repeat-associated protein